MSFLNTPSDTITGGASRDTMFSHVFSTTEEGKAEILNILQYAILGVVPIIVLNKLIQRFIPEADTEKSSVETAFEILVQLVVMFSGIVLIHRVITYVPTYSGFKYDGLALSNVALAFLMIVLSIQTKLGIKVNILADRLAELWNGPSDEKPVKKTGVGSHLYSHTPSQADTFSADSVTSMFPPAPVATPKPRVAATSNDMLRGGGGNVGGANMMSAGPMAANSLLGGAFGSLW